jgi:adenine-specific DNA-methyltransferase
MFGDLNLNGKEKLIRYFEENGHRVLMVYDSRVIPYVVNEIAKLEETDELIKIYIFCDGTYPYSADFKEVISKVDLIPMPGAMLQALKYVLPQQDDMKLDSLDLTESEINNELKAAEIAENKEQQ